MIYRFHLSELTISLCLYKKVIISDEYVPFLINDTYGDSCQADFSVTDSLSDPGNEMIGETYDCHIYQTGCSEYKTLYFPETKKEYYAESTVNNEGSEAVIHVLKSFDSCLQGVNNYFHLIHWEKMLICHSRFILHSACIRTEFGGILFSGVSGIGKSTQADLWIRYRNAELINGDRTILFRKDCWRGYGSPFAGSSRCYKNEDVRVRAIVMLEQSDSCSVRRLSVREAFRSVYSGTTIYIWDPDFVQKSVDLILCFVNEIPVYLLSCTPDECAVTALEDKFREDGLDHE